METDERSGTPKAGGMIDPVRLLRALQFAAEKHVKQRRKDVEASPYINHPIAVAAVLASEGGVSDERLLIAAVLHDTIEDTKTTAEELRQRFGSEVAALVLEVTDDKTLAPAERKRLQILHAASSSRSAKQLKIADKICNLRDLASSPPAAWSAERKREYVVWASAVVDGCRGVNRNLDEAFDAAAAQTRATLGGDTP